jgi:hypothetical protein
MFIYLTACTCLSISLPVHVYLSHCLYMFIYLTACTCLSISLPVHVYLSLPVHVYLSLSVHVYLSHCMYMFIYLTACTWFTECLSFLSFATLHWLSTQEVNKVFEFVLCAIKHYFISASWWMTLTFVEWLFFPEHQPLHKVIPLDSITMVTIFSTMPLLPLGSVPITIIWIGLCVARNHNYTAGQGSWRSTNQYRASGRLERIVNRIPPGRPDIRCSISGRTTV